MLSTLRSRLIVSYLAVVLLALLLATLVFLVLGIKYKRDDAYHQLTTGLYMIAPQIENVLVRERIMTAVDQVQNTLLQVAADPAVAQLPAAPRTRVLDAVRRLQADLVDVQNVVAQATPGGGRVTIAAALADARQQLVVLQAGLPSAQAATITQALRRDLGTVETPLGTGLTPADRDRLLAATAAIRGELQSTSFRLLLVRPEGSQARVLLDSLPGAANKTGWLFPLPAALQADAPPDAPVPGVLTGDGTGRWLYEAAPPGVLVARGAVASRFYVVLASREPNIGDVVQDFVLRFLAFVAVALVVALVLGLVLARSITRPLGALARATHAIAEGDYTHQAPISGSAELQGLAVDFNQMAAQVAGTQRAQQEFLANVSHDLKTPLTSIQGFSQAMVDGTLRDRQAFVDAAAVINAESLRMTRLVGDLVDLVRLQSGEAPVQKRPTDVGALLRQTAAGLQPQATARHVELRVESPALPPVPADPDRLQRAVTNLVDNALRHTPPEGRVTLYAQAVPGGVRIGVADTGAGIPAEDLPRVFERFYQVDKSRAGQGQTSGLGLAIVREIAAAHGGGVAVQSAPGAGSDFTITLPV